MRAVDPGNALNRGTNPSSFGEQRHCGVNSFFQVLLCRFSDRTKHNQGPKLGEESMQARQFPDHALQYTQVWAIQRKGVQSIDGSAGRAAAELAAA